MTRLHFAALAAMLLLALPAAAEKKPRWVGNTPQEGNSTYRFVEVVSYGGTLAEAAEKSARQLAQDKALQEAVTINAESDGKIVSSNLNDVLTNENYALIKVEGTGSLTMNGGTIEAGSLAVCASSTGRIDISNANIKSNP